MKTILVEFKTSLLITLVFAVLLCGAYPLAVWAGGRLLFRQKADGSLVVDPDGTVRGSTLLAQNFSSARYFHPRPSVAGTGYDAGNSNATNLGPTSDKLANGVHAKDAAGRDVEDLNNFDGIKDLVAAYRAENGLGPAESVPADAVTRSASGLDPDISVRNARIQAGRVARARNLPVAQVEGLVASHIRDRDLGIFGEPRVNVLLLNLALDQASAGR
jgi:K+-transporting ATPase ATPase C chain